MRTTRFPPVSAESLERVAAIARAAGNEVLRLYDGSALGGENGERWAADILRTSHRVIVAELNAWAPLVPIVSEGREVPAYDVRQTWARFWLVDALDGTKEFLTGNGEFTVNIALVEDEACILGVVFAPALDQMYMAGRGLGSWRQRNGRCWQRLWSSPASSDQPLRVVESRSDRCHAQDEYVRSLHVIERIELGSSLKFCRLAEGRADLYPRFTPMMEWDAAAGDCVYRYSGAVGERRSPIRYNHPDLQIRGFVLGFESGAECRQL